MTITTVTERALVGKNISGKEVLFPESQLVDAVYSNSSFSKVEAQRIVGELLDLLNEKELVRSGACDAA